MGVIILMLYEPGINLSVFPIKVHSVESDRWLSY